MERSDIRSVTIEYIDGEIHKFVTPDGWIRVRETLLNGTPGSPSKQEYEVNWSYLVPTGGQ